MIHSRSMLRDTASSRTGATLVEVLMALLIMAVGVTSVFTLFPLAILKAVKANQLTNAKLFEGSITDHLMSHSQLWTGAPEWSPATPYGQLVDSFLTTRCVTPRAEGRLLPTTNQMFYYDGSTGAVTSGRSEPKFSIQTAWTTPSSPGGYQNVAAAGYTTTQDNGVFNWNSYLHSPSLVPNKTGWTTYVVDPLGWYKFGTGSPDSIKFGRVLTDTSGSTFYLDRIHSQLPSKSPTETLSLLTAEDLFQLSDSWNEIVETTPVTVSVPAAGRIEIAFPDGVDVTNLTELNRLVVTSTFSQRAVVLPVKPTPASLITYPNNSTLEIDGNLPAGFTAELARLEVQSPSRYSWLMVVHAGPGGEYHAQCAVVFNRTFELLDEQGFRAEFCITEDLNHNGVLDSGEDSMWLNNQIDTHVAKLRWSYSDDIDGPRLKEGGFIFDASFGYWYRIQKIEVDEQRVNADDSLSDSGAFVRSILKLSDPVQASTGVEFSDYLVDGTNDAQAVVIPGVIHVFSVAP